MPVSSRIARSLPKVARMRLKARVPGSTAFLARMSASITGREWFSFRRVETVDFPVAMLPVRPTISILVAIDGKDHD